MAWLKPSPSASTPAPAHHERRLAWLQPQAFAQPHWTTPLPSNAHRPASQQSHSSESFLGSAGAEGKRKATWLQPSPTEEASAIAQPQRPWLQPHPLAASATPSIDENAEPLRTVNLDMATVLMATDEAENISCRARNGMDPSRVADVLRSPCSCEGRRCQSKFLPLDDVLAFLERFHHLSKECQSHLIATSYNTATAIIPLGTSVQRPAKAPRTNWTFLGHPVCVQALQSLLGMSATTLYRYVHDTPDRRRGVWSAHPSDQRQRRAVDQFFSELYMSAAEHLAEQHLDIDNIDDAISYDDAPAGREPMTSMELTWSPHDTMDTLTLMATSSDRTSWPPRYLQHGKLSHLWWQFLSWWSTVHNLGQSGEQCQASPPSWSTFWRAWDGGWSRVLLFRKSSSHSCCTQCFQYQEALQKSTMSAEGKKAIANNWRDHLKQQYHDRMIYWHLRWFSRHYRASSVQRPASPASERSVLTVIIDSMDKSKLVWPQYAFRQPKCLDKFHRPRMVLTLAMAHGWTNEFFLTDDEVLSHGASHFSEVLCKTLDRVADIATREGIPMPKHLVVQSDNTTAQAKNSQVGQFLATLVAMGKFETCTLNFLIVGHTHEDVDLAFGILLSCVLRRFRIQTPAELATMVEVGMGPWAAARGEECHCTVLHRIRDFGRWLAAEGIHIHNCWMTRAGIEAPHSFAYKLRCGLTDVELRAASCVQRGVPSDQDVLCVVKHRMHSMHPNGPPVTVLPQARFLALTSAAPTQWEGLQAFPVGRADSLREFAQWLESATEDWGPGFSYFRAAAALHELVDGHTEPPMVQGWLTEPVVQTPPASRDTGNVYFGHLPDMSWRMLVAFRR